MDSLQELSSTEAQSRLRRDVLDQVRKVWGESGFPSLKHIGCVIEEGKLVIRGNVPSYYMKQMAQVLVLPVRGAPLIVNELFVIRSR